MASEKLPKPASAADAAGPAPVLTFVEDGCVIGHWNGLVLGVWARPSTVEIVAEQERVIELVCAQVPKFSTVHIAVKGVPLPGADVRAAYQVLLQRYAPRLVGAALLVEGRGFWASAARGFLTSLQMLDWRLSGRTFGDLDSLVTWIAPLHGAGMGKQVSPEDLRCVLASLLDHPMVRGHRQG